MTCSASWAPSRPAPAGLRAYLRLPNAAACGQDATHGSLDLPKQNALCSTVQVTTHQHNLLKPPAEVDI